MEVVVVVGYSEVGMITVAVAIKLMIMVVMTVVETIRGILVMAEVLMKVILLLL